MKSLIKQLTELLPGVFAIEIDEHARDIQLQPVKDACYVKWQVSGDNHVGFGQILIPPDSYEILFTTKACSEEQAGQLPLGNADEGFGYKDYEGKSSGTFYADHSLQSLLRSHNLTGKNYLLIKRNDA